LAKRALSRIVPVELSTALSTNERTPRLGAAAPAQRGPPRLDAGPHRERVGHVLADPRQVRGRHREAHQRRVDPVDDDERVAVRLDQVPLAHEQASGAARDRRADRRVLEIETRAIDRRPIGLDGRPQRGRVRADLVVLLGRHVLLRHELLVALRLLLGVRELGLITLEHGLRLIQRGSKRARVDLEEHLPLLNRVTLAEAHAHEETAHLRADGHRLDGLHGPRGHDLQGHGHALDGGDRDGQGRLLSPLLRGARDDDDRPHAERDHAETRRRSESHAFCAHK